MVGCGFRRRCYMAAICLSCGILTTSQWTEEPQGNRCSAKLLFLEIEENLHCLVKFPEDEDDLEQKTRYFRDFDNVRYCCPDCKKLTLQFFECGLWD